MFCQRCGKRNVNDAETCRYCKAPLLVVRPERPGESADAQAFLGIEDYLIDKISTVERQAHRSSEDVDLLVQAVDYVERNVMVNRAGINVLVRMLREKGVLEPTEFKVRWRERTLSNLEGLYRKEQFLDAKPHVLSAFSGKNRRRFEDLVLRAEDMLYAFEPRAAVRCLEEALSLDPGNTALLAYLGESYLGMKDYPKAMACLDRVVAGRPSQASLLAYAHLLVVEGRLDEAEKALAKAARKEGARPDAWVLTALIRGLKGEWKRCAEAAAKALEQEESPGARFVAAHAHIRLGRWAAAEDSLDQLLADFPDVQGALLLRAALHMAKGWWRRAEETLEGLSDPGAVQQGQRLLARLRKTPQGGRRKAATLPLEAGDVLAMMDRVADEADMYLRQMDAEG